MCEMKKYFYFQLETNIEVELLCGKLEFFKISGPEEKKKDSYLRQASSSHPRPGCSKSWVG